MVPHQRLTRRSGAPPIRQLAQMVRPWAMRWGISGLERQLSIRLSTRMTRSLGRCTPAKGSITLRSGLSRSRLPGVLCHEAAHVAAFRLHGPSIRPHGAEWAALVSAAGFEPMVREFGSCIARSANKRAHSPRFRYAHTCTVCQSIRWAQRPMARWRCTECTESGLPGDMTIVDTRWANDRA